MSCPRPQDRALPVSTNGVKVVIPTNEYDSRTPQQLKALFADQQQLITRLAQDHQSYQGYLSDLVQVWKLADAEARQQIRAGQPPTAFADCIRYALLHTTIVGNLHNTHVMPNIAEMDTEEAFAALRAFTESILPTEADPNDAAQYDLESARQIEDAAKRAEVFFSLAERSTETHDQAILAAVEAALTIPFDNGDIFSNDLWKTLSPRLTEKLLTRAFRLILASPNEVSRAAALVTLAPRLSAAQFKRALDSLFTVQDTWIRVYALRSLPRLDEPQRERVIQEIYRSTPQVDDQPLWSSQIWVELIDELIGEQREAAIQHAMDIIPLNHGYHIGWVAQHLIPHLNDQQRTQFIETLMNTDSETRIEALLYLWEYLPRDIRQRAIDTALQIRDRGKRADYLAQIAKRLRGKNRQVAIQHTIQALLEIRNESKRLTAIAYVQKYLHDPAIEQVKSTPIPRETPGFESLLGYDFALIQSDSQYIAYGLGNLSRYMGDEQKAQVLPLILDISLEIYLEDYMAEALERIAPYLTEDLLKKALEGALRIGEGWSCVWALSGLAPHLIGEPLQICLHEMLEAVGLTRHEEHHNNWFLSDAIARILPFFEGDTCDHLLEVGSQQQNPLENLSKRMIVGVFYLIYRRAGKRKKLKKSCAIYRWSAMNGAKPGS